jgi:hypothetical protein
MGVQLKVIHLIRRLDRIRRDIEELERLQSGIREDREYATRIIDPLIEETQRLKKLRNRILSQIIKSPPESLQGGILPESGKKPEVILPESEASKPEKPEGGPKTRLPDVEKRRESKGQVKAPAAESKISYRFIFDKK